MQLEDEVKKIIKDEYQLDVTRVQKYPDSLLITCSCQKAARILEQKLQENNIETSGRFTSHCVEIMESSYTDFLNFLLSLEDVPISCSNGKK